MSVVNDGWAGDGVSPADAMFERAWTGKGPAMTPRVEITEGPLAAFRADIDPVKETERLRSESALAMRSKTARVNNGDGAFESTNGPGQDRVVQGGGRTDAVEATRESASVNPGPAPKKPTGAPAVGALMKKLKGRQVATKVVSSDPPPAEPPPSNLADGAGKSSFTGSGPQAALHNDYSKVGSDAAAAVFPFADPDPEPATQPTPAAPVDDEDVRALLKIAGVPPKILPPNCMLWQAATSALSKTASDEAALGRDDIHPLKLLATLDDRLGSEWREWEPETIIQSLSKVAGHDISEVVANKVMAMKLVLQRPDVFYDRWDALEKIAVALNDVAPTMSAAEDVPPEWLSNAVAIVSQVAPGDFGSDTASYVAARLFDAGYVVAPPLLRFADAKLGELVHDDAMRKKVIIAYAKHLGDTDPIASEDPVSVQVARIMGHHAYVLDKFDQSNEQLSS